MKVTCPLFKKTWHLSLCDKRMDLKKTYERILWPSSFCVAWPFKIWVIMALHNLLSLVAFKNLFFSVNFPPTTTVPPTIHTCSSSKWLWAYPCHFFLRCVLWLSNSPRPPSPLWVYDILALTCNKCLFVFIFLTTSSLFTDTVHNIVSISWMIRILCDANR